MTPPTHSDDVICALAAHVRELTQRLRATEAKLSATAEARDAAVGRLYDIRVALFDALHPNTPGSPVMASPEAMVAEVAYRLGVRS